MAVVTARSAAEAERLVTFGRAPCVVLREPGEACRLLAERNLPVIDLPIRVSASGIRRMSKRTDELAWLAQELLAQCAPGAKVA